ncbi:class I SAM-dependent methyltransferase [Candidatus Shapirobacteria bacterium]|nr:class I SAM-dependent methyltransferase [Candidatus Shapirobacteria bacterium]
MSIYHDVFNTDTLNNPNTSYSKIISYIKGRDINVLDVGCSSGYLGEIIKHKCLAKVWGIDNNQFDVGQAKNKIDRVFYRDLQKTNFQYLPNHHFDYIVLADVLEHLTNPKLVLQKLIPKLKPTGHFIISIPNFLHYSIKTKMLSNNWHYTDYGLLDKTHVHFYGLENFEELITSCQLHFNQIDFVTSKPLLTDIFQEISQNKLPLNFPFVNQFLTPPSFVFQYIAKVSVKKSTNSPTYPPRSFSNSTIFVQLQIFKIKNFIKNFLKW